LRLRELSERLLRPAWILLRAEALQLADRARELGVLSLERGLGHLLHPLAEQRRPRHRLDDRPQVAPAPEAPEPEEDREEDDEEAEEVERDEERGHVAILAATRVLGPGARIAPEHAHGARLRHPRQW